MKHSFDENDICMMIHESLYGTLLPERARQLETLLSQDPQAMNLYVDILSNHSVLRNIAITEQILSQDNDESSIDADIFFREVLEQDEQLRHVQEMLEQEKTKQKIQNQAEKELADFLHGQDKPVYVKGKIRSSSSSSEILTRKKTKPIWLAIAACCMVGIGLWLHRTTVSSPVVAEIINTYQAQWSVEPQTQLQSKEYYLKGGLAEIKFNDGAKIILEGPSRITFESANGAYLDHGKLTAQVPERAKGFTVVTPISTVVDFGTEFGIEVDSDASVLVQVFKGSVGIGQNHLDHKDFTMIKQGQGKQLKKMDGDLTVIDVPGNQAYFSNRLNKQWNDSQVASISAYQQYIQSLNPEHYFPFEPSLESMEGFIRMNEGPRVVSMGAKLYKDQTNYALELNSESQHVILDVFQRKEKREAFSVMLWVKQSKKQTDISPLLYSATFNETGYPVVALYLENQAIVFDSATTCDRQKDVDYIISKSDITPNQWACIVVTKKEDGDISLYVNGKHDKTINKGADCPLFGWEDICLGYNSNIVDEATRGIFDGYIDEVAFFDYVLPPDEIENIYKHDSLVMNKNNN